MSSFCVIYLNVTILLMNFVPFRLCNIIILLTVNIILSAGKSVKLNLKYAKHCDIINVKIVAEENKVILSIGMIVKNEEKNLRKCLDSLKPIMNAVESELIIVDTGSTDNTVSIAKEYTDNIYTFVWCKDFAAARNVSLENARGEWFMFIDADEFFGDSDDLISFFTTGEYKSYNSATYIQRNYTVADMSSYSDFNAPRLTKKLPETIFISPIHERFNTFDYPLKTLSSYVHHFGYLNDGTNMIKEKSNRNIELLLPLLEKNPEDTMLYLQLAESYFSLDFDTAIDYCKQGIKASEKTNDEVQYALYCKIATAYSSKNRHKEVLEYVDAYFNVRNLKNYIGTDIEMFALKGAANTSLNNYTEAIEAFKKYVELYKEYQRGGLHTNDSFMYSMNFTNEYNFRNAVLSLINSLIHEKKFNTASVYSKLVPINKYLNEKNYTQVRICQEFDIMKGTGDYSGAVSIYKSTGEDYIDYVHAIIRKKAAEPDIRDKILTAFNNAKLPSEAFTDIIRLNYLQYCKGTLNADEVEKYLEKYKTIPTDCADIICMTMNYCVSLNKLIERIPFDSISNYISNCITICSEFVEVLIEYNADSEDIRLMQWLYRLYKLAVLSEEFIQSPDIEKLFAKYSKIAYDYVKLIFRDDILNDEKIMYIPSEYRSVYYCQKAAEMFEQNSKAEYLSCLKDAVHADPILKDLIKALGNKVKNEVKKQQTQMSEFDLLALKVKKNIIQLIENGKTEEAERTLSSYEQINPKDTDIAILKKKLGI